MTLAHDRARASTLCRHGRALVISAALRRNSAPEGMALGLAMPGGNAVSKMRVDVAFEGARRELPNTYGGQFSQVIPIWHRGRMGRG